MAPPSPSPTSPTADDSPSAPANGHQNAKPMKRISLVTAKLEITQARDASPKSGAAGREL